MQWVKSSCCPEINDRVQNEYGAWVETGKVGNQKVSNPKHAELQILHKAYREAVMAGDVDKVLDIKFSGV